MPNHIKSRIELNGNPERITALVAQFGTFHEKKPSKAHDDSLIYRHSLTKEVGWLNPITNQFTRRGKEDVEGVPDGFEQEFEAAYLQMPDFNNIKPMPDTLNITSGSLGEIAHQLLFGTKKERFFPLSIEENQRRFKEMSEESQREAVDLAIKYQQNLTKYGSTTWYDWAIKNWGTKWNSYDCEKVNDTTYEFDTAWSGVPQLIEEIATQYPDIEITYKYSDEDTGSNCGHYIFFNGNTQEFPIENGSKEAYELAFELRPDRKENYKLVGDSYEWVDDEE